MNYLVLPLIHSNGTSPDELYRDYRAAMEACLAAVKALERVEFNSRDYYPIGPDAFTRARVDRAVMFGGLRSAADYCLAHAMQAQKSMRNGGDL
jgi:hypothetical protein